VKIEADKELEKRLVRYCIEFGKVVHEDQNSFWFKVPFMGGEMTVMINKDVVAEEGLKSILGC